MSKRKNINTGIRNISKNFTPANKIEENIKLEIITLIKNGTNKEVIFSNNWQILGLNVYKDKIYFVAINNSAEPENENDVSEQEIQNILAHYKRLGKNEEKYVNNLAKFFNIFSSSASSLTSGNFLSFISLIVTVNVTSLFFKSST